MPVFRPHTARLLRSCFILAAFTATFLVLRAYLLMHSARVGEPHPEYSLVQLLAALPLVAGSVWLGSVPRAQRSAMTVALAFTSGVTADWLMFEALSSFHGELPHNEAVEMGFNTLMVLGFLACAWAHERESHRRRASAQQALNLDPLTGVLHRHALQRAVEALPPGRPAILVLMDINGLQAVNATAGHGAGDAHIRAVARALQDTLPPGALLGRWGDDEFLALLPEVTFEGAQAFTEAANARAPKSQTAHVALAVGLAPCRLGEALDRPLALAEQRLNEHKHQPAAGTVADERLTVEGFSHRLELLDHPQDVLEVGLGLARQVLQFDGASAYMRQAGAYVLTHYQGPDGATLDRIPEANRTATYDGLVWRAAATGLTTWTTDYTSEPQADPVWVAQGLKSVIAAPVRVRGQVVGVLGLTAYRTWRAVTSRARQVLEAVALRLGHALERQQGMEEVRATLEGGMLGLGLALEGRDLETAGHTERVVGLAESLGQALGLPDVRLAELRQGAYLHDIGKLSIPDAVLLKPARLTPDEWQVMQSHAARGADLASRIPTLSPGALAVIRHHHERWDGSGYPDGLQEEDIPLLARIFAVVDVYDALTSVRPYKLAWTRADALSEVAAQAGRQFDPHVVSAFLNMMSTETTMVLEADHEPDLTA